MGEQYAASLDGAVESYAHWWREAGFHTAIEAEPHSWRRGMPAPFWQRDAASAPLAKEAVPAPAAAVAEIVHAPPAVAEMPTDLRLFLDWLGQDENHPEATWDGPSIRPTATLAGKVLILVEMPAMGATDDATLLDPAQHRFIAAMLASIGVDNGDAQILPLAMRRPPGGLLDEATMSRLTERMRHFLALARPGVVVILGDRTSRALVGAQWQPGTESLQGLDLSSGTVRALALAAPDLLMNRPAAKMRSWQALRLLQGIVNG